MISRVASLSFESDKTFPDPAEPGRIVKRLCFVHLEIIMLHHSPQFATVQVQTVPSIPWDVLQAPALVEPSSHYAGHLPDGSSVQAHSADADFARYGLVMVAHDNAAGCILWTATRYGRPIISGRCYCGVLAAGRGLIIGA